MECNEGRVLVIADDEFEGLTTNEQMRWLSQLLSIDPSALHMLQLGHLHGMKNACRDMRGEASSRVVRRVVRWAGKKSTKVLRWIGWLTSMGL